MKTLPDDPLLLMSVVNTKHRDDYVSLDALCEDLNEDRVALEAKLTGIGISTINSGISLLCIQRKGNCDIYR